jgi:hypothetical protein
MSYPTPAHPERPRMVAVYDSARILTLYGTPILLAAVGLYLNTQAFGRGPSAGLRSLAALLFSVVIASCLYVFHRDLLRSLGRVSPAPGFLIGFAMGIVLMVVLELVPRASAIPLAELTVSGCFSVLVFASVASDGDSVFTYYYGALAGLLLYVIVRGLPAGP